MSEASWRVKLTLRTLRTEEKQLNKLLLFGDSQSLLAEGYSDGCISIIKPQTNTPCVTLTGQKEGITAFTVFNNQLVSAAGDSTIKVWIKSFLACSSVVFSYLFFRHGMLYLDNVSCHFLQSANLGE